MGLDFLFQDIVPDFTREPAWSGKIKRWSQLDAASFIVAEATHQARDFIGNSQQVILLSTQGSGRSDHLFAHHSKISPSYFVHTLPNVRGLAFGSISAWEGPVFCFSQGKYSLVKCFHEVILAHSHLSTLIVNFNQSGESYQCDFYRVGPQESGSRQEIFLHGKMDSVKPLMDDFRLREELKTNQSAALSADLMIRKME